MHVAAPDCPLCTGRDTIPLDRERMFCPWCLHEWTASGSLIVDLTTNAHDFTRDLTNAIEVDG